MSLIEKEKELLKYWEENEIYKKWKEQNKKGPKFFYLDGPPYTSGKIHLGHTWGKALRDMVMRYKRKKGFDVFDRPGFDMHGLPIEKKVEQALGLKDKSEIGKKISVEEFIKKCKEFAISHMEIMIEDFKRVGIFMDWDNPYMSITNDFIANVWFMFKKAHEKGLVYEGETVNYYCEHCATVLAKHELEYYNRKDPSIFIKFKADKEELNKRLGLNLDEDVYFLVWTTTPWTLPFNLGIMVNPEEEYVLAKVERNGKEENLIIAKKLLGIVLGVIDAKLKEKIKEFLGKEIELVPYEPLFDYKIYEKIKEENPNAFKVWLADFVSMDSGTGLVHGAPGCGPEDYEIGRKYGVKPFNLLDERGYFGEEFPDFKGLRAKVDDEKIIEILKEKGVLVFETEIEHSYAHCWRCKNPIIFKTTKQWFLKISALKDKLLEDNKDIYWVPESAKNAFNSWLQNIQDWVVSRQRFWGVPLPIWKCENCGYWTVKDLNDEDLKKKLEELKIEDYHIPKIDKVTFTCPKCQGTMKRVKDVLDVWIDSGTTSWNVLGYPIPNGDKLVKRYYPVDLILEGKDQIRGWFYSLAALGEIVYGEIPYKAVYMHGFIKDSYGRKMSKSLGNVISPYEVIDKYGADTLRYYQIGGTGPGEDLNYNFEDMKVKYRNLITLNNIAKFLEENLKLYNFDPENYELKEEELTIKERYMLHLLNKKLKEAEKALEKLELNKVPWILEEIFLELSKFYIKVNREDLEKEEKRKIILKVIYEVLFKIINAFSIVAPFITEDIYLRLYKNKKGKESINFFEWPKIEEKYIDEKIEEQIKKLEDYLEALLFLRNKEKINVRWPLSYAIIEDEELLKNKEIVEIIKSIVNVKNVTNDFSKATVVEEIEMGNKKVKIGLNTNITEELFKEGFTREIIRRIQALRKELNLTKDKKVKVSIELPEEYLNKVLKEKIEEKTNSELIFNEKIDCDLEKEFKIKDLKVKFCLKV
jgi:isoleucyl-tRNA synthetase